jgi:hypothetical protein
MVFLGCDPGGSGKNGLAIYFPNEKRCKTKTVDGLHDALSWYEKHLNGMKPSAAGIDTLMFWELADGGWRKADQYLKQEYPRASKSIISPNSLYGSMAVQGIAFAMKLKKRWENIALTETHPKVLYLACSKKKYKWNHSMNQWAREKLEIDNISCANDHEWDALISAWAAYKGFIGEWKRDLACLNAESENRVTPLEKVKYWW